MPSPTLGLSRHSKAHLHQGYYFIIHIPRVRQGITPNSVSIVQKAEPQTPQHSFPSLAPQPINANPSRPPSVWGARLCVRGPDPLLLSLTRHTHSGGATLTHTRLQTQRWEAADNREDVTRDPEPWETLSDRNGAINSTREAKIGRVKTEDFPKSSSNEAALTPKMFRSERDSSRAY